MPKRRRRQSAIQGAPSQTRTGFSARFSLRSVWVERRTKFAILIEERTHGNEESQGGLSICPATSTSRGGRCAVSGVCNDRRKADYLDLTRHRSSGLRTLQSHAATHSVAAESVSSPRQGWPSWQTVQTAGGPHVQAHPAPDGALLRRS